MSFLSKPFISDLLDLIHSAMLTTLQYSWKLFFCIITHIYHTINSCDDCGLAVVLVQQFWSFL